ncbi:MAG: ribosome maturation factor RimP [Holosporaceae bacterium]|nr:ribosome maturation factor RimP [Holosporaceae bacterium]
MTEKIEAKIGPSLEYRGYEVVRTRIVGGKNPQVTVDIDRLDSGPVTLEDCTNANHLISVILDVEDFIEGSYTLEVSSPGENRPLKKISDFERFCGRYAKVETIGLISGRRKFHGKLLRVEQNLQNIVVYLREECDTGLVEIGVLYSNIKKASVKRF